MSPLRLLLPSLALVGAVVFASACGGDAASEDASPGAAVGPVVATTSQIGALAREVIGDVDVELHTLLRPGVNPHDYEPSAAELAHVSGAELLLRNGLGLDDFLDDLLSGAGVQNVVTVTEGIPLRAATAHEEDSQEEDNHGEDDHGDEGGPGEWDPHVWHNPQHAQVMVQQIEDALAARYPALASQFRENGAAYRARLAEVDAEIASMFRAIPAAQRKVVMAHDSLGYFLERYEIEFVGAVIPSTASGAETSARALAELVDLIRSEGVRAVFAEESVDPRVVEQLGADAGIAVVTDLYGDTLGAEGTAGATVDGMLLHNAGRIADALR